MRECPKCHYVDPPWWRNRLFDYETDICRLEDMEKIDLDLMCQLILNPKGVTKDQYVYKLTKTGWVYRIWKPLFEVRGWNPQKYYDPVGSKASMLRKMNLQAYSKFGSMNERRNMKQKLILQEVDEIRSLLNNLKK
jgi:hypothetical protein